MTNSGFPSLLYRQNCLTRIGRSLDGTNATRLSIANEIVLLSRMAEAQLTTTVYNS
ncbi:hypothetical protein NQ317_001022 [Molorchus minor]|uniref:Uncharacterized protein n=1 Tax=Molorchus minor TaxID=1323400 RepID=A0ABQ9K474_9CUCU|nr:hypothetical protein NQ317_001022 [Molorchus minor]